MSDFDKEPPPGSEDRIRQARERFGKPAEEDSTREQRPGLEAEETEPAPSGGSDPGSIGYLERLQNESRGKDRARDARVGSSARPPAVGPAKQPWYARSWIRILGLTVLVIGFQVVRGDVFGTGSPAVGDCFNSSQLLNSEPTVELTDVDVVRCEEPHLAEVFATADYPPDGAGFPGNEALNAFAVEECAPALEAFIDGDALDSGFDVSTIAPTSDAWGAGNRAIECLLVRLDGQKAVGSAENGGAVVPGDYVSFFRLAEGDCVDLTDWFLFGLPRACSEPHDLEVFAVLTIPEAEGAPYSSVDQVAGIASSSCAGEFQSRVDPGARADIGFAPVAFPLPFTWALGHRTYVCGLFSTDAAKLQGSRLLALDRHGDLVAAEFADRPLFVDFDGSAGVDSLDLVGSAHFEGPVLALTKFAEHADRGVPFEQERPQRGAAWWSEPIPVDQGFVTSFVFQFEMYSWFTVGDGLAFVVQGVDTEALGVGIGYDGMPDSLAIEFDTLKEDWLSDPINNVPGAPDLLGNHVSVQTRGVAPNDTHTDASLGWANLKGFYMADRAPHVALVVYEPGDLKVYVDDFDTPVVTVDVDLARTLRLADGKAYVGFTASSGPETSRGPRTLTITGHKVLAWELALLDQP